MGADLRRSLLRRRGVDYRILNSWPAVLRCLAVEMGSDLDVGVPFYGSAPKTKDVPRIKAALLIHYAENDDRINAMRPAYEAALKASSATFQMHTYSGTRHGFHNNSTPRFDEMAAKLAWERTIAFFRKHLS